MRRLARLSLYSLAIFVVISMIWLTCGRQTVDTAVIIRPTVFVAEHPTEVIITGMQGTLRLRPQGAEGEDVVVNVIDGSPLTITLPQGIYALLTPSGPVSGQRITAAEPYPPKPLGFFDGTVLSLRSHNFEKRYLQAHPTHVVIDDVSPPHAAARQAAASFRSWPATAICSGVESTRGITVAEHFVLESCAHPGMVLAHGLTDGAPLRLTLAPAAEITTSTPSADARGGCTPNVLFTKVAPGLANAPETVTLVAGTDPGRARRGAGASSSNLVVRHAYGKVKLTAAGSLLGGGEGADKLLAADATWALAPPAEPTCGGRARGAAAGVTAAGAALSRATHRATLSIRVGEQPLELSFELFGRVVPKTVDNFVRLCRGSAGGDSGGGGGANARRYAGTKLQRVIPGFMAQGGATDGGYGESADGGKFPDESFALSHDRRGVLSMANAGEDTNGSQFFVLFAAQPHLDGKHVVFGRLVAGVASGEAALRALEAVGSPKGVTTVEVRITECRVESPPEYGFTS